MPEEVQLPLIADVGPLCVSREAFCVFEVPGEPRGWERPGTTIRWSNGKPYIHWYTRAADERWRNDIAWVAKFAMRGREPATGPLAMLVHAFLPIPASWHWKQKQAARAGAILPTDKPDWDNLAKVTDALKGIVWDDDARVVDGRCLKRYSDKPGLRVEVRKFVAPK